MNREAIYSALFTLFANLAGSDNTLLFKTATRNLKTFEELPPEGQPAILMQQRTESGRYVRGLPTVWEGHVVLYVYVTTQAMVDQSVVPAEILNPLLDAIEAAIAPDKFDQDPDGVVTLGGLVSHVAIEGTIEIFQGDLGNQEVAMVPITFLTAQ